MSQENKNPYGWDSDIKVEKKQSVEREEIENAFFNTFKTPDGKKTLNFLVETFLDARVCSPELGLNGILYGYVREGQNYVVREIQKKIKKAEDRRKGA